MHEATGYLNPAAIRRVKAVRLAWRWDERLTNQAQTTPILPPLRCPISRQDDNKEGIRSTMWNLHGPDLTAYY